MLIGFRFRRKGAPKAGPKAPKHPAVVRSIDMAERLVFLADGSVLQLDQWMGEPA